MRAQLDRGGIHMMCGVALALSLAACWTGDPPPPAAPAPPKHARAARRHAPVDVAVDSRAQLNGLKERLRLTGSTELPPLVWGPVVVLDMDTGLITSVCGPAAAQAAHDWGAELSDPTRRPAICDTTPSFGTDFFCTQFGPAQHVLILAFDDVDQPHLRGALIGGMQAAAQNLPRYKQGFQSAIASPTCPP